MNRTSTLSYQEIDECLSSMRAALRPFLFGEFAPLSDNERTCLEYYGLLIDPEEGQQAVGYFMAEHHRLACYRFRPAGEVKGSCFLLHGYYDHTGIYGHLIRFLMAQGLEVLAFDLPGHGLSSGPRASIDDFEHYRLAFEQLVANAQAGQLPEPWYAMAQSTGAGVLADYLLTHGFDTDNCPFTRTVLMAPLLRPHRWWSARLAYYLLRPFISELARSYSRNSSDQQFLDFVRNHDPLQPRTLPVAWVGALTRWIPRMQSAEASTLSPLIVQGDADKTVDWRFNTRCYQALFPDAELLTVPGGGHHLANESAELRKHYSDWLADKLNVAEGAAHGAKSYTGEQQAI